MSVIFIFLGTEVTPSNISSGLLVMKNALRQENVPLKIVTSIDFCNETTFSLDFNIAH